ncbi:thiamine phosphate synthase [Betaproteobacteria bacterium PRO7]|jgi:thiamine-phosphate pyrophosphorylase|nr:thiamine phosphate synthase [Betaproteobacteria bacterium PRO7]
MKSAEAPRGVYLLTPDWTDTPRLLATTAAALAAGVRWLQYRNKSADAATRRAQALALRELTLAHGAKLVVNDDTGLAIEAHADGVHVGRDDPDPRPRLAREGVAMVVGVSCYDDFARAQAAVAAGADYVAFGAVFASPTKPAAVRAPLALLSKARAAGMHAVAIGGIGADNIAQVAAAGAHAAALITAVYDAADPGAAARELISKFKAGEYEHESQRTAV